MTSLSQEPTALPDAAASDAARRELHRMLAELEGVRATLEAELPDGPSSELSHADQHPADVASDLVDNDREVAMIEGTAQRIAEVTAALARLDDGSYGTCLDCATDIPAARLEIRPEAARCVGCQQKADDAG